MSNMLPEIDRLYIDILIGGTLEAGVDLVDEAGQPLRGGDGWVGRMQLRDRIGGPVVATFAEPGGTGSGAVGTLRIDDFGHALLVLPSSASVAMSPTSDSTGRNNRLLVGDIDLWKTAAPSAVYKPPALVRARVIPEVTTS